MYADVYHGQKLSKHIEIEDGDELSELDAPFPKEFIAVPELEKLVAYLHKRGATDDDLPIYYGDWPGDVDFADLAARCDRARVVFAKLPDDPALAPWLKKIKKWLAAGHVVAIFA